MRRLAVTIQRMASSATWLKLFVPDGSRFWFMPWLAVLRDPGAINLVMDITDRKEHFRAIVETTPDCVRIVAPMDVAVYEFTGAGDDRVVLPRGGGGQRSERHHHKLELGC